MQAPSYKLSQLIYPQVKNRIATVVSWKYTVKVLYQKLISINLQIPFFSKPAGAPDFQNIFYHTKWKCSKDKPMVIFHQ